MKIISIITDVLIKSIERNGSANLVVSGGSSPIDIFKKLSICNLSWKSIFITLVDDRLVSSKHKDSNEALIRKYLLVNKASKAMFIPIKKLHNYPNIVKRLTLLLEKYKREGRSTPEN